MCRGAEKYHSHFSGTFPAKTIRIRTEKVPENRASRLFGADTHLVVTLGNVSQSTTANFSFQVCSDIRYRNPA